MINLAVHLESNDILSFRSYFQSKGGTFFETPGINTVFTVTGKHLSSKVSSLVNDQQETAMAYYLKNAERLTPCDLHKLFAKWRPCQASKRCLLNRLKYLGIRQNVTVKSSFDQCERSSAGNAEGKPVVCPKPMDIESPQCSSQRSTAMDSPCMKGMQISSEGILHVYTTRTLY